MLANLLVVLGVLALLHSASTYLLPNFPGRTWRRATSGASPTIAFSSSSLSWNVPKNFESSKVIQPSTDVRPTISSDSPPKHIILNTLKTGMKLDGYVVSSTPYAAFIDAGVVRVSKGGSFSPVHAMLHKSDIPKEVLNSLRKDQHQFPSRFAGPSPLLPKNTPLSVFVKEVTKQTGRFTVTTDSTVTREDLSQEHLRVREEASERRRSRRLRRQLENVAAGTTTEGIVDKVVDEGVLVTITSLGSLNVTGLIRKKDMPQHLKVPEAIKMSHQNQLLQQDFTPGRPVTCAISEVHPNPHTANVYNLKLSFEDFNGTLEDDQPVEDIFDSMTEKEQKAWLLNRRVEDLDDEDNQEDEEDSYDDEEGEGNERDDFEQDYGDFDQEVSELYEELLKASTVPGKGNTKVTRLLLPVESVYDWDAVQDMISSGEIEKADVDQAIRSAGVSLRGGALNLAQFKDVVEALQDKIHGDDEYESDEEEEEEEPMKRRGDDRSNAVQQKKGEPEVKRQKEEADSRFDVYSDDNDDYDEQYDDDVEEQENNNYDSDGEEEGEEADQYDDDEVRRGSRDTENEPENEEEEQSFDEIVAEVFDELKNDQHLVPVSVFKAWEDVQEMVEGGVIRQETLNLLIDEVIKSNPTARNKGKMNKSKGKKMAEPALNYEQFDQLVRLLDEMVNAQESAEEEDEDDNRDDIRTKRVQITDEDEEEGEREEEGYDDDDDDVEGEGDLSEEEQDAMDAADAKEAFQELSADGKTVTVKSLRNWDEIRDLLEEEILDQESLDVLIRTANGDLTRPMNLETFTDLLALINDAVSSVEDNDEEEEFEDYDDDEENEEEQVEEVLSDGRSRDRSSDNNTQRSTNSAQKIAASVDEREASQRARSVDNKSVHLKNQINRYDPNDRQDESEDSTSETEDEEPSDEELEALARQAYEELLPKGRSTVPVKVFESWPSVQEEVTAGMLTPEEIRYVLKKVDPRNTHQLTFEQFTAAMDMLEMKIQDRAEEMEQQHLDEGRDEENHDDEDGEGYDDEENDFTVDFDDDEDSEHYADDEPVSGTPIASALPPAASSSIAAQSAKPTIPMSNSAPTKFVPNGAGVGFDKVTLPDPKSAVSSKNKTNKNGKSSADVVEMPTSLEDTEKEIDALMVEMTQALYDELRGDEEVLTVEKFKQWKDLQEIFNEGVVSKSFFDRAVKATGAAHTGPISWKQFGAVLDAVQSEAEKSYPDDDGDDYSDDYEEETDDVRTKEAQAKALAKVQEKAARAQRTKTTAAAAAAAAVAASLDEASTRKNDNYDFSKVFETLEEVELKKVGIRKSKKVTPGAPAVPAPNPPVATSSAAKDSSQHTASDSTSGGETEDNADDEYPVHKSEDELARQTYDKLRGTKAQPTVADLLHWDDIIELIDRRALSREHLVKALTDAQIDANAEKATVSPDQFLQAVRNVDQYIDFSKLEGPDLTRYDQSNIMIHGAGSEIDELLREGMPGARPSDAAAVAASVRDVEDDGTDEEMREIAVPAKRKPRASTSNKEKASKKVTSKDANAEVERTAGAETAAVVSAGLPVELVNDSVPAETEQQIEKVKKPRKTKKAAAAVVMDTEAVEEEQPGDPEIKEMFATLSKGKDHITEKALRNWEELRELVQANLLSPQDLDHHLGELNLPASGRVEYPAFEKFVRLLDEVLIDENGDFLPADQKHRAISLDGVTEIDE